MTDAAFLKFVVKTPIGDVSIIYRESPFLINRILLPSESSGKNDSIPLGNQKNIKNTDHPVMIVSNLLFNYFKGRAVKPLWKFMSLQTFTSLQEAVLRETAKIPFGGVTTYQDIAIAIGHPKAYRFVGSTLAKNSYPILIPCHRVIRSDHQIGQFGGGTKLKKRLIDLEAKYR